MKPPSRGKTWTPIIAGLHHHLLTPTWPHLPTYKCLLLPLLSASKRVDIVIGTYTDLVRLLGCFSNWMIGAVMDRSLDISEPF